MKRLTSFFLLLFCTVGFARGPGILDYPEYIAADASPVLFYLAKKTGKIVVRQCDEETISPTEDSCKGKSGTKDMHFTLEEFRRYLRVALLDPTAHYSSEMKEKIRTYSKIDLNGTEKAFALAFYGNPKDTVIATSGLLKLLGHDGNLFAQEGNSECKVEQQTSQASLEIDKRTSRLMASILSSGFLLQYSKAKENLGFEYNILKSYFNNFVKKFSSKK